MIIFRLAVASVMALATAAVGFILGACLEVKYLWIPTVIAGVGGFIGSWTAKQGEGIGDD